MNVERESRRLHLVYSRAEARIEASRFVSDQVGPQRALFPEGKPGLVVFLRFAAITDHEFAEVLRLAQPSFVFDLRMAPRFDVGLLNRKAAFALFHEVHATYVDATAPIMMGEHRAIAMHRLQDAIQRSDFRRPLVFLMGSDAGSIASDSDVLNILASLGKPAADVVSVPA